MFGFCKHEWKLINTLTVPSEVEHVAEVASRMNCKISRPGGYSSTRKYITDYTCGKCGKLKRLESET